MIIRTYEPKDEKDLISLWVECKLVVPWNNPAKDIQRKQRHDPDLFFVGLIDEKIMASCMAGYDGHRGWIYYLAVTPACQKKGYAKKLLLHAKKALSKIGCPKINLMVRKTNNEMIQFYKAMGYDDDPVSVLSLRIENDLL